MEFTTQYVAPKGQDHDYDAPTGLDDKLMHTQRTNAYPGLHPGLSHDAPLVLNTTDLVRPNAV